MMPSVLGKRSRSSADQKGSLTRSKRRAVLDAVNDENQNPFVRGAECDGAELDRALGRQTKETRGTAALPTAPAKHGKPEQRVVLSPSRINKHVKADKPTVPVFEDSRSDSLPAPRTPRHRDAVSKKVPVTPRHRVLVAGGRLTPSTPRTPGTPSQSVYQEARRMFSRCAAPGPLVGRDEERSELSTFVHDCVASQSAGCLYVSGPPGTGKSALVEEVVREYNDSADVKVSLVNCMSVRSVNDLSQKLAEDFGLGEAIKPNALRSCFVASKLDNRSQSKYLVVLDEVDRLVDLDLSLLYSLFEWSMQEASSLILIGIANALDLTDRFLPRLKARELAPGLLPFLPYTATQISDVLTSKLQSLAPAGAPCLPFLHPAAIQFCSKKVAAQTGDLRKAFDICRRAIDLVEQETKEKEAEAALLNSPSKTPLMENINLSSPPIPKFTGKHPTPPSDDIITAPKATIAHVAQVTAQAFSNGTTQRLATLNLQQKAVLCTLAVLEKGKNDRTQDSVQLATPSKKDGPAAPTVKRVFEAYTALCNRDNLLHPLTSTEFRDVVSGLESLSLVVPASGKAGSFSAIAPATPSRTPGRRGRPPSGFGKAAFTSAAMGDERRVASAFWRKELVAALDGPGGELLREMLEG